MGFAHAETAVQRQQLEQFKTELREAGKEFSAGKFEPSAKRISAIQASLATLVASKDAGVLRSAKPLYDSLQRAHTLLELEGVELKPLPSWKELSNSADAPTGPAATKELSFKNDVAPLLIAKCGTCHIDNSRGQFTMATFADLMKGSAGGKVYTAGNSKGSRMIELIESGDMPRGSGKILPDELTRLKKWIDDGAKFDGPAPEAQLRSYAGPVPSAAANPAQPLQVTAPVGKEIVKYSKDVAPILLKNCNGCHIAGRRAQGQFSMDTFVQLLRGGESGEILVRGKPAESLLVKKVKGESGVRMPPGNRTPLTADEIQTISTWILEGASFDGSSADMAIQQVADQAWAAGASHSELLVRREERALAAWRKVLPKPEPVVKKSSELVMLGNVSESRLDDIAKVVEQTVTEVKRLLKLPAKEPLVKGGMILYVFRQHYDYSEYGRMNEQRQLPANWRGHWRSSVSDVYAAIVDDPAAEEKHRAGLLLQVIGGARLGAFEQTPLWFSEGVARNLAITAAGRNDPRILAWQQSLAAAVQKVDKSETLLRGQLDEESVGLIGMSVTKFMMDRANRKRFDALLKLLHDGQPFPAAATATYAPPDKIIQSWLGKK